MKKQKKEKYVEDQRVYVFHKTSIGRNPSLCKMNKSKRRQFKFYKGQGR